MFPIKYIDNNLVWNKDNEVFAYYELIPYNYIYWGIHITICVNYNQHMVEVIPVRFPPPASWKRMST